MQSAGWNCDPVGRRAVAWGLAAMLAGCGGGNSGDSSSGGDIAFVSLSYPDTSVVVGASVAVMPVVSGIPNGKQPNFAASDLPPGLSINAANGAIKGTATTAVTNRIASVTLTVPGYSGSISKGAYFDVSPAPTYHATRLSNSLPPLLSHHVVRLGGVLYDIGSTYTYTSQIDATGPVQTWRSTDEGVTWTNTNSAPSTQLRYFSVAQDANVAYLTGGTDAASGLATSEVWRFDGSAWARVTATAPFLPRRRHASLVSAGFLYVSGGVGSSENWPVANEATGGYLADLWRSADGGTTWARVGVRAPFPGRFGHCMLAFGGKLWVLGGHDGSTGGGGPTTWQSPDDGVTWVQGGSLPTTYTTTSLAHSGCAVHRSKLVVYGGVPYGIITGSYVSPTGLYVSPLAAPDSFGYSSADGLTWARESMSPTASSSSTFAGRYGHALVTSTSGTTGDSLHSVGGYAHQDT